MNKSETLPSNSETITQQGGASLSTSTPPGERGLATTSNSTAALRSVDDTDSELVERLLPMLRHSINLRQSLRTTSADGSSLDGGARPGAWVCEITPGVSVEMLRESYRIAEPYCRETSDDETVVQALYALGRRTKSRAEDDAGIENRVLAYTTELTKYPANVIIDGCKEIARSQPFFPSLSEMITVMERLMSKRWSILTAIEVAGRKAAKRQQPEARNSEIDDLRSDPCWIEWMRQVNDNPLTVKPWEQFKREWPA